MVLAPGMGSSSGAEGWSAALSLWGAPCRSGLGDVGSLDEDLDLPLDLDREREEEELEDEEEEERAFRLELPLDLELERDDRSSSRRRSRARSAAGFLCSPRACPDEESEIRCVSEEGRDEGGGGGGFFPLGDGSLSFSGRGSSVAGTAAEGGGFSPSPSAGCEGLPGACAGASGDFPSAAAGVSPHRLLRCTRGDCNGSATGAANGLGFSLTGSGRDGDLNSLAVGNPPLVSLGGDRDLPEMAWGGGGGGGNGELPLTVWGGRNGALSVTPCGGERDRS